MLDVRIMRNKLNLVELIGRKLSFTSIECEHLIKIGDNTGHPACRI